MHRRTQGPVSSKAGRKSETTGTFQIHSRLASIIIVLKGVTPAGRTQRYYIAGGLGEEKREENTEKEEGRGSGGF